MSDTFFQSGLGGGSSSGDYVKDSFQDTTLAATNNTGIGSTLTTNPLGFFLGNTDSPTFRAKTLLFDRLEPVTDRSLWIGGNATFEVKFSEDFPAVRAYATGSPRIQKTQYGTCVSIQFANDIVAVNAKALRMGWIIAPVTATGTAKIFTDGADTGRTATFGSSVNPAGYNSQYTVFHQPSDETDSLHDFRLVANEFGSLNVIGVIVYFQDGIVCNPGVSYIDKNKVLTSAGSSLSIPANINEQGYRASIFKTQAGAYGVTQTAFGGTLSTFGNGANGAATVTVTTGTGASFPVGTGLVGAFGTSQVVSIVTNVSTDTLTVTPVNPFGFSGTVYRSWIGGQSLNLSDMTLDRSIDLRTLEDPGQFSGIGVGVTTSVFWQDRFGSLRLWGNNLTLNSQTSVPGIANVGGTLSILQVDGEYSAMELELASNGFISATFSINGIVSHNISTGATGIVRRSVLKSGPGYKSVRVAMGASNFSAISKINLYGFNQAATLGLLASFDSNTTNVPRYAINATLMPLGPWHRVFADGMYFTGPWERVQNPGAAGGVEYRGSTTTCAVTNRYIGSNYGFVGHGTGASMSITLNGGAVGATFGILYTGVSTGFNTLVASVLGGTAIVQALSYQTPFRHGELKWQRTDNPTGIVTNSVYNQSNTPVQAKDGDIWLQDDTASVVWLKSWGRWLRLQVSQAVDDPNLGLMFSLSGSNNGTHTGAQSSGQAYSFGGVWSSSGVPVDASAGVVRSGGNEAVYNSLVYRVGGVNSSNAFVDVTRLFNRNAWAAGVAISAARGEQAACAAYGFIYEQGGSDGGGPDTDAVKSNGGAWASIAACNAIRTRQGSAFINNILYLVFSNQGTLTTVEQRNSSDATSTAPNTGVSGSGGGTSCGRISTSVLVFQNASSATTTTQSYNGVAFSSAVTSAGSGGELQVCGSFLSAGIVLSAGGLNAAGTNESTTVNAFNGIASSSSPVLSFGQQGAIGGVF